MSEKEILNLAFAAFESGEECKIKLPPASKIHDFNMAVNSLEKQGLITVKKRNMTELVTELTEAGLETFM